MPHLRLVPSPEVTDLPSQRVAPPAEQSPYDDPTVVALSFFESASGLCLCRSCSKKRHPAFGR